MRRVRFISWFMVLILVFANLTPMSVFASEADDSPTASSTETVNEPAAGTTEEKKKEKEAQKEEKKEEEINVHTVSISKSSLSMLVGESEKLTSEVLPENAKERGVIWKSSAEDIVSVDQQGKITAKSIGKAKVTVTTKDQGLTAACQVEVSEKKEKEPFSHEKPW